MIGANDGELAVVIEVLDTDGETVIDLAAWPIGAPERILTMFGCAPALGIAAAANPATYILDWPLPVLRSGLDWLKADGRAFVILDQAEGPRQLRDVIERGHRVAAQGVPHAIELRHSIEGLFDVRRIVCATEAMGAT